MGIGVLLLVAIDLTDFTRSVHGIVKVRIVDVAVIAAERAYGIPRFCLEGQVKVSCIQRLAGFRSTFGTTATAVTVESEVIDVVGLYYAGVQFEEQDDLVVLAAFTWTEVDGELFLVHWPWWSPEPLPH